MSFLRVLLLFYYFNLTQTRWKYSSQFNTHAGNCHPLHISAMLLHWNSISFSNAHTYYDQKCTRNFPRFRWEKSRAGIIFLCVYVSACASFVVVIKIVLHRKCIWIKYRFFHCLKFHCLLLRKLLHNFCTSS